ncbi:hypothetical protein ACIBHX_30540 [Nonomuraea sp. NPDC050536]|uniref:hypothetical protein n=1 Tax=Nonomuraea sp. NPDC050536 TaxID=3364366 RepID=UPI0037C90039
MRPIALWWHEARRAGLGALLGPPVLAAPLLLGIGPFPMAVLEAGFPLLAGVAAAMVPGRDPAAEVRLAIPRAYRLAMLRRLAVVVGCAGACSAAVTAALMLTGRWTFAYGGPAGHLVWLAPALWLAAFGFCCAVVLRGTVAATSLVGFVWAGELLGGRSLAGELRLFAGPFPEADLAWWPANRAILLGTAVLLCAVAWIRLGDSERVLGGEPE